MGIVAITGANTGIGRVTAVALAQDGHALWLLGRSFQRHQAVLEEISALGKTPAQFLPVELGSLQSVAEAAHQLRQRVPHIDVLINNAGVAGHQGLTQDGFEIHFGTNHLSHFLLTLLLWDQLADQARVIAVSSGSHKLAQNGIDYARVTQKTKTVTGLEEYGFSKLANILFTRELARRHGNSGRLFFSLHPGTVATEVWRRLPSFVQWLMKRRMLTPEQGAQTTLHCVRAATAEENGAYFTRCKVGRTIPAAQDDHAARALWEKSLEMVGPWLEPRASGLDEPQRVSV